MADSIAVQIQIATEMAGDDVAMSKLLAMSDRLVGMGSSAASFDAAISQMRSALSAASAASAETASALEIQQAKYSQLERAAVKAAQAVEKAQLQGKPTGDLQAAADAAAASLSKEAAALDKMKDAASKAVAEEKKLGAALKNLEGAAKGAEAASKKGVNVEEMTALAKGALGPMGGLYEKATLITKGLGKGGVAGFALMAGVGLLAFTGAVFGAVFSLAKLAVTLNKGAMEKLDKITKRVKEDFAKLFSGVHVEKFIAAFEQLSKNLDENSSSAKGLKAIVETMLNPLFDKSSALLPILNTMFRGMVLGALWATIAVVWLAKAISDMFPDGMLSNGEALKVLLYVVAAATVALLAITVLLTAAGIVLGVVLGVILAGAVVWLAAVIMILVAAVVILAAIWLLPIIGIILLITYFDEIIAYLGELGSAALSAAGDLIGGFVSGIMSGCGAVYEAIRTMANGAIETLKSTLGIASPSKVFALQGKFTGEGFIEGVEGQEAKVQGALESMVSPVDAEGQPAAPGAGGASAVTVSGNNFVFNGVAGMEDAESRFGAMFTKLLRGDVESLGGLEPAT